MVRETIYEALCRKLNRPPTQQEIKAEVRRIIKSGYELAATNGKLRHQRK